MRLITVNQENFVMTSPPHSRQAEVEVLNAAEEVIKQFSDEFDRYLLSYPRKKSSVPWIFALDFGIASSMMNPVCWQPFTHVPKVPLAEVTFWIISFSRDFSEACQSDIRRTWRHPKHSRYPYLWLWRFGGTSKCWSWQENGSITATMQGAWNSFKPRWCDYKNITSQSAMNVARICSWPTCFQEHTCTCPRVQNQTTKASNLSTRLEEITQETQADETMQILMKMILQGWPDDKYSMPFLQCSPLLLQPERWTDGSEWSYLQRQTSGQPQEAKRTNEAENTLPTHG